MGYCVDLDLEIQSRHRLVGCSEGLPQVGYKPGKRDRRNFISCYQLLCYEFHGLVEVSLLFVHISFSFFQERSSS
jgi:hypothetical protein